MVYVDTSVLAAYYCPESMSDDVEAILVQLERPAISPLTEVELFSAIGRKIREKQLSQENGKRIIARFHAHIEQSIYTWIPLEERHFKTAGIWISQFTTPLRTLDALHLAVASIGNMTLLTADQQLASAARHFGIDLELL